MRLVMLLALFFSAATTACAGGSDSIPAEGAAGAGDDAAGATAAGGNPTGGGAGGAAGGGAGSPGPVASWEIDATISLNGHDFDHDTQSAVARKLTSTPDERLVVELTSAPDYCGLLQDHGCLADGEFVLSFEVHGTTPGVYSVDAGEADVFMTSIDLGQCTGAGLGAGEGSIVVSEADLAPGGAAILSANVTFFGGPYLKAEVTAPFCDVVK